MKDTENIIHIDPDSDNIFIEFYRHKDAAKRHIRKASGGVQKEFLDDIYHESLILAHKRKIDDPDRTYSLCMFSAYNTILRVGFYKELIKEDNLTFIDHSDVYLESDTKSPEELMSLLENTKMIIEIISILFLYGKNKVIRGSEALTRLCLSDNKETLASIGRTWGVSRERVRQVSNESIRWIREMVRLYCDTDLFITDRPYFLREVDFTLDKHNKILSKLPYIYRLDYLIFDSKFTGFDALIIYLIAIVNFGNPEDTTFSKIKLNDYLKKGTITMSTNNTNIFLSVPHSVITIWYKSEYNSLDICYGREVLCLFEKRDKGWIDTFRFENPDNNTDEDPIYYENILEAIDTSVLDFLSESLEQDLYLESENAIKESFFDLNV